MSSSETTSNTIYNEDCLLTLDRELEYDYVFFSPPEYSELNLELIKDKRRQYHEINKDKRRQYHESNKI